jgi:hypothetical protein
MVCFDPKHEFRFKTSKFTGAYQCQNYPLIIANITIKLTKYKDFLLIYLLFVAALKI